MLTGRQQWCHADHRVMLAEPPRADRLTAVEAFFVSLLVFIAVVLGWFAGYVVYRLYRGPA